jgi:hypothetical protein
VPWPPPCVPVPCAGHPALRPQSPLRCDSRAYGSTLGLPRGGHRPLRRSQPAVAPRPAHSTPAPMQRQAPHRGHPLRGCETYGTTCYTSSACGDEGVYLLLKHHPSGNSARPIQALWNLPPAKLRVVARASVSSTAPASWSFADVYLSTLIGSSSRTVSLCTALT